MRFLPDMLPALALALIAAYLLCRLFLLQRQWLPTDRANDRSLHVGEIPRTGGLAVALAGAGGLWAGWSWPVADGMDAILLALVLAAMLAALSFMDDWKGLPVGPRLGSHLLAAGLMACELLPWPAWLLGAIALAWMTNLFNFMDGMDGLAGGMALIGFLAYGLAAMLADTAPLALASWVVAAAAAGFLALNFPPAKLFLGDVGSIPLGFLAGALGLAGWQSGAWPFWFPLLVFSPFIVDATVTLLRRLLGGAKVWQAHRDHYYQRLVRMGWSHRRTTLSAYGLMLAVTVAALGLLQAPPAALILGIAAVAAIYAVVLMAIDRAWRLRTT